MKKSIALIACSLLAIAATQYPTQARQTLDALTALQVKKGMAAFNRHDYATAGLLLRLPAERGASEAQWPAPIRWSRLNVSVGPVVALRLLWPAKLARVAKPAIVEPLGPAVGSQAMSAAEPCCSAASNAR